MSKIDSSDLVDIFKEEATKKAKKEIKKQKKQEKKLEKRENAAFNKIQKEEQLEKTKELKKQDDSQKIKSREPEDKRNESVLYFLFDVLFGFFLILLLFCTVGFIVLEIKNGAANREQIKLVCLGVFVLFYILSSIVKKGEIQKLSTILASASICLWMVLTLYYA